GNTAPATMSALIKPGLLRGSKLILRSLELDLQWNEKYSSSDHYAASDMSARAALAQSTSFSTAGAPLNPIAPTTSPFTLMGNPPPHAATRASVGIPAKSDGSPWIKLKKSCVETPNRAVYALFWAISMQRIGAPSIRLKALRLPPSSRIATFSRTPSSLAFATAASTICCASSEAMLCFFTTLAIGHLPSIDGHCALIQMFERAERPCRRRVRH